MLLAHHAMAVWTRELGVMGRATPSATGKARDTGFGGGKGDLVCGPVQQLRSVVEGAEIFNQGLRWRMQK